MLSERRRRRERAQRGSVLSAVLIIVAFLSILGGALMNEITTQFLLSRALATRVADEATVNSSVEYAIGQLQTRSSVPPRCSTDRSPGPLTWSVNLNGKSATAVGSCQAIVPDLVTSVATGAFPADGTHDTSSGRNRYLVADASGRLYSYQFGQTSPTWSVSIGGALTAPPAAIPGPGNAPDLLLAPVARHVAVYTDSGGAPQFRCNMQASANVTGRPAAEATAGGSYNFPSYSFFGDARGNLYVYDATSGNGCTQRAAKDTGNGAIVGALLVFPGRVTNNSTSDEIFALVTSGNNTTLQHWTYSETVDDQGNGEGNGNGNGRGQTTYDLSRVGSTNLGIGVATGYDINSTVPAVGSTMTMVVAGSTGRLEIAQITVHQGQSYTSSTGRSLQLPSTSGGQPRLARPPYWWNCPGQCQDMIGVGSTNGALYVLDTNLNKVQLSYDGAADGRHAINTTPAADANGDWYFGADDGFIYDVERPASGTLMFKAARFGPGGLIQSSPVVGGPGDGCSATGPCLYFGATGADYFAQIGKVRVMDLTACLSAQPCSTAGTGNPRLWARLEVGSPSILGGQGVNVTGWSYYNSP
jgi:hypothetical protein